MYKNFLVIIVALLAFMTVWWRQEFSEYIAELYKSDGFYHSRNEPIQAHPNNLSVENVIPGDELIKMNHISQAELAQIVGSEPVASENDKIYSGLAQYFELLKALDLTSDAINNEHYTDASNILLTLLNNKIALSNINKIKDLLHILEKIGNAKPINIFPDKMLGASLVTRIITVRTANYDEIAVLKAELNKNIRDLKTSYYSVDFLKKYIENEQTK